jgi:hypothetical protein
MPSTELRNGAQSELLVYGRESEVLGRVGWCGRLAEMKFWW